MPKTITFKLNATLKAGSKLFLKGTIFDQEHLPQELMDEVNSGSGTIEIISFGDDLEGSEFNPDKAITLQEPEKKVRKKKIGAK